MDLLNWNAGVVAKYNTSPTGKRKKTRELWEAAMEMIHCASTMQVLVYKVPLM